MKYFVQLPIKGRIAVSAVPTMAAALEAAFTGLANLPDQRNVTITVQDDGDYCDRLPIGKYMLSRIDP